MTYTRRTPTWASPSASGGEKGEVAERDRTRPQGPDSGVGAMGARSSREATGRGGTGQGLNGRGRASGPGRGEGAPGPAVRSARCGPAT